MVRIKRKGRPKQLAETSRAFKEAVKGMSVKGAYDFYNQKKSIYRYNTEETKRLFKVMNHERCSFCTRCIQDFQHEMTVEHIRTKRDFPKKIFEWNNLLCSCRTCNTKRSISLYDGELYLDPTKVQDIERYFHYYADGSIEPDESLNPEDTQKAKYMIKLYGLDREDLKYSRRKFFEELMSDDEFYDILKKRDPSNQSIIFLSVFTYYRRCMESYGK